MTRLIHIIIISIVFHTQIKSQAPIDPLIIEGDRYFEKSHEYFKPATLDSCHYYTWKALYSYKESKSSDHIMMAFNGLSNLSHYQGNYIEQKQFLDSAYSYINEDSITMNVVWTYANTADYLGSLNLIEEAESKLRYAFHLGDSLSMGDTGLHVFHNNIASLFARLKNYKAAIDEIELALELMTPKLIKENKGANYYFIKTLINKSAIFLLLENYSSALSVLETAKLVSENSKKEDQSHYNYLVLIQKAKIHYILHQYKECLNVLAKIDREKIKESEVHFASLLRLETLSNLNLSIEFSPNIHYLNALSSYPDNYFEKILEYYGELAYINSKNGFHNKSIEYLNTLITETAKFKESTNPKIIAYSTVVLEQSVYQLKIANEIDSLYSLNETIDICNNLINAANSLRKLSHFSSIKTEWSEEIEELLPTILGLSLKKKVSDDVLINISELIKQKNANESSSFLSESRQSKIFQEVKTQEALIAKYEEFLLSSKSEPKIQETRITLSSLRNELSGKIETLKRESPLLFNKIYQEQNIHIADIQQQLTKDEVVLNYLVSDSLLCVCTIESDKSSCYTTPINFSDEDFLNLFSLLKSGNTSVSDYKKLSKQLYNAAFVPFVNKDFSQVTIIPHGSFSYVPFHALVDNKNEYLISNYSFNYQLNLNLLVSTSERKQTVIDGVNIFNSRSQNETNLLCREKEISNITQAPVDVNTDIDQLLTQNDNKKILHVIAHASSSNEDLSGEISEGESMLSGLRIKKGNIKSDLIILSSCESGIGINTIGEGVSSLNSAIFHNDIGASISALWKIDDCSTAEVLSTFYDNISNQKKDEALRTAMLNFINDAHPSRRHPHFWAGLVQYGNTDKVRFENDSNNYLLYALGLLLSLLIAVGFWTNLRKSTLS